MNVRSAHVETLKVERFRMREGRKGERPEATPPIMPRGVDLFLYTRKHVPDCPQVFSWSSFFFFLVTQRWRFTLFGEWGRLLCTLVLYGTYRVHDEGVKFAGADGAYRLLAVLFQ